ncbi:hypothetical protein C1645_833472 [Glomus cerebriforme]|uniref:Uncharacterized protein n=1 Tax=Glomus cerebriforme TaxID=658196 RepID=A0A397SCG7_9GLOM|nr:hypothetical protein C1645_833472 [Glomus cerebriforme]
MAQNLPKCLKNKLALLDNFPNGNDYLNNPIYSTRHSWIQVFANRIFMAGMQSTQCVESINVIIHKVVNSSSTIADVAETLDSRMQKEEMNKNFIAWKYKSTIYHQPFTNQDEITENQAYLKSLLNLVPRETIKEPFIGASSKNLKPIRDNNTDQRTYLNPRHYNSIQEVEICHITQKKVDYGQIIGHFKKALNYSFENNDQENLDDIILAYILEKERNNKTQSEKKVLKDNLTNQLKMSDGRIYDVNDNRDLLKCQEKGRLIVK